MTQKRELGGGQANENAFTPQYCSVGGVSEIAFGVWHEAVGFHAVKFKCLNIHGHREVVQVTAVECLRHKQRILAIVCTP